MKVVGSQHSISRIDDAGLAASTTEWKQPSTPRTNKRVIVSIGRTLPLCGELIFPS